MPQPEQIRFPQPRFDTLEVIDLGEHLLLIQNTEENATETLVIGNDQAAMLLDYLQKRGLAS